MVVNSMDYLVDSDIYRKPLIIAFGGISGQIHQPLFEFKTFLQNNIDCHFIYLKDTKQAWYQLGVVGLGDTITDVSNNLKEIIKNINYSTIITIGSSMGGYAAMLFGSLIGANSILAFGPQTFICPNRLRAVGDTRVIGPIDAMHAVVNVMYDDLTKLDYGQGDINIIYGNEDALDRIHAERIRGARITAYSGNHSVVKTLRDNGILIQIIKNIINKYE